MHSIAFLAARRARARSATLPFVNADQVLDEARIALAGLRKRAN